MLRVFIGDIKKSVTSTQISSILTSKGKFHNLATVKTKRGTKNIFIDVTENDLENFLISPILISGKEHYCQLSQKFDVPDLKIFKKRIYVNNIPKGMLDSELQKIFEKFGKVLSAFSVKTQNLRNKGYGFVFFDSSEIALKVVKMKVVKAKKREFTVSQYRHKTKKNNKSGKKSNLKVNLEEKFSKGKISAEFSISPRNKEIDFFGKNRGNKMRTCENIQSPGQQTRKMFLNFGQSNFDRNERLSDIYRISRQTNTHHQFNLRLNQKRPIWWC